MSQPEATRFDSSDLAHAGEEFSRMAGFARAFKSADAVIKVLSNAEQVVGELTRTGNALRDGNEAARGELDETRKKTAEAVRRAKKAGDDAEVKALAAMESADEYVAKKKAEDAEREAASAERMQARRAEYDRLAEDLKDARHELLLTQQNTVAAKEAARRVFEDA